jgi:hypothetical protein
MQNANKGTAAFRASTKLRAGSQTGMRVAANVRAGALTKNDKGIVLRTRVFAGGVKYNHNQEFGMRARTRVRSGGIKQNHSQSRG